MITKIFTAIDDQAHSGWAVSAAIELAHATSSTIVFYMANPAVLPGRGPPVYLWTMDYIREYFDQAKKLAQAARLYDVKCLSKNTLDVAKAILMEAENECADYIVMGSNCRRRRFGGWKNSITREVSSRAHCPTIIVHNRLPVREFTPKLAAAE